MVKYVAVLLMLASRVSAGDIYLPVEAAHAGVTDSATAVVISNPANAQIYTGWNFASTGEPCVTWSWVVPSDWTPNTAFYLVITVENGTGTDAALACWRVSTSAVPTAMSWGELGAGYGNESPINTFKTRTVGNTATFGFSTVRTLYDGETGATCATPNACTDYLLGVRLCRDNSACSPDPSSDVMRLVGTARLHY